MSDRTPPDPRQPPPRASSGPPRRPSIPEPRSAPPSGYGRSSRSSQDYPQGPDFGYDTGYEPAPGQPRQRGQPGQPSVPRAGPPARPGTPKGPGVQNGLPGGSGRRPLLPLADLSRVVGSLPGVARIAAGSALNTAEWSLSQSLTLTRRLVNATHDPEEMVTLAHELGVAVGVVGAVAQNVAIGVPLSEALDRAGHEYGPGGQLQTRSDDSRRQLREAGELLLAQGRDVWYEDSGHPAYLKIIGELTQDEARILLLLVRKGPQPSVDVHRGGLMAKFIPEVIATGMTMIGARAGCRHQEDIPRYLNNLHRLGLLEGSAIRLPDPGPYQVLEVQPDVLDAMKQRRFTTVVRRSIHLTPFGRDFCRAAFGETAHAGLPAPAAIGRPS